MYNKIIIGPSSRQHIQLTGSFIHNLEIQVFSVRNIYFDFVERFKRNRKSPICPILIPIPMSFPRKCDIFDNLFKVFNQIDFKLYLKRKNKKKNSSKIFISNSFFGCWYLNCKLHLFRVSTESLYEMSDEFNVFIEFRKAKTLFETIAKFPI